MTNKEAIELLKPLTEYSVNENGVGTFPVVYTPSQVEALELAIVALKHEANWEDVKQALNGWLNNITSPNTALNDVYRAYKRSTKSD